MCGSHCNHGDKKNSCVIRLQPMVVIKPCDVVGAIGVARYVPKQDVVVVCLKSNFTFHANFNPSTAYH